MGRPNTVVAGLGADVLRVDPPEWDEPAVLPYVMWGKRSARVDARLASGRGRILDLLAEADVLIHGYRGGALERLGLGADVRSRTRLGLIEVAERAYGWSGPWAERRGFDSIVQFATGSAHSSAAAVDADAPLSLPVQASDWTTGYLAAAASLLGLTERIVEGTGTQWRLSLARTAETLIGLRAAQATVNAASPRVPLPATLHETPLGSLRLNDSPIRVGDARLRFDRLTTTLGTAAPVWL